MNLSGFLNRKKIKYIQDTIEEYKKRSVEEQKYFLLASESAQKNLNKAKSFKSYEYLFNLYKEWDDYGSIPLEIGQYFESIINNPKYNIGIHRTGGFGTIKLDDVYNSNLLRKIFSEGLKNYGDASSGAHIDGLIQPKKTISMISSMLNAVILLKTHYKDSKGAIITVFPSEFVNLEGEIISDKSDVYYLTEDKTLTIKPEYLVGFISENNGVCEFYPKESFISKTL